MDIFVREQLTAFYESLQNTEIYLFICPFAFRKKNSVFILLGKRCGLDL